MLSDLRFAFRQLAKSPGFTVVAVLTLALGIGANTAIFSVINSALLRPLRFSEPAQLVQLWTRNSPVFHFGNITGPQFKQFRDQAASFSAFSTFNRVAFNLIDQGKAERIRGLEVSVSYLPTLRCEPALGRNFDATADQIGGGNQVAILTHEWWQSRFGGDPGVVGRTVNFNQASYTVVGVLPPRALLQDDVQFLVPLVLDGAPWRMHPETAWLGTLFRLRPGVTAPQAEQEVQSLAAELNARLLPGRAFASRVEVQPLQAVLTETARPTLLMLLGAVTLVLLIACANVANLLLARARSRQKEMAVRSALGATGGRIIRQMLTESLVLSLLGGIGGVVFAAFGVDLLGRAIVDLLPAALHPALDLRVLAYSLLLACGTGVVFGLFPALQARRVDVNRDLQVAGRGSSGARTRTQSLLIIAEVALTAMLLIGCGLLLRSFARVLVVDPGFDSRNTLVGDLALTERSFASKAELLQFQHTLVQRLEALPGVVAAGISCTLPVSGEVWGGAISLPDQPADQQPIRGTAHDLVAGNYFPAMGITLVQGRVFTESDNTVDAPKVAVINQQLADELLLGQNAIGRRVRVRDVNWEIIGVVGSVRHGQVDRQAGRRVYLPNAIDPYTIRLVIRTRVAPLSLAGDVRRVVTELNADQAIANLRTLEQAVGRSLQERRVALVLITLFAVVALGLACLGIYGVMAYTIGQRERELAIRMALGAQGRDVLHLVLRDGLGLGLIGIVTGLLGGLAGSRLIASRLYEVGARDPVVFAVVCLVVTIVTVLAVLLPARRATKVDPMVALRAE